MIFPGIFELKRDIMELCMSLHSSHENQMKKVKAFENENLSLEDDECYVSLKRLRLGHLQTKQDSFTNGDNIFGSGLQYELVLSSKEKISSADSNIIFESHRTDDNDSSNEGRKYADFGPLSVITRTCFSALENAHQNVQRKSRLSERGDATDFPIRKRFWSESKCHSLELQSLIGLVDTFTAESTSQSCEYIESFPAYNIQLMLRLPCGSVMKKTYDMRLSVQVSWNLQLLHVNVIFKYSAPNIIRYSGGIQFSSSGIYIGWEKFLFALPCYDHGCRHPCR